MFRNNYTYIIYIEIFVTMASIFYKNISKNNKKFYFK